MIIDESEGELLKQSAVNLVLVSEQPSDSSETDAAPNIVPLMVTAAKLIKNQS